MNYYIEPLKKYAVFTGRARRKEYWSFVLFQFVIYLVAGLVLGMQGQSVEEIDRITFVIQLIFFVPSIAAGIRRMHDIDKSGWFILIPFYNLYLACLEGTKGPNKYGPDPKEEDGIMTSV